ncbi:hypothetical protein QUA86_26475 [Microcoleus sp. F6_B6]
MAASRARLCWRYPKFSVTGYWRDRPHRRSGLAQAGDSSSIALT